MSTATLHRTQEGTAEWQSMFPLEQTTEIQSAVFVKKLLAIAVSNITYLRGIFPERAFADRSLEDLSLKVLRDSGDCPGATQVIQWVKGCFDALDKKYLKMLIIGLYVDPNDPDNVIESYTFKFSYADNTGVEIYRNNKKVTSAQTTVETKKATIRLLRTIIVLSQSMRGLPDEVMMTMKLLYYDDVTPMDYEPPGFVSAQTDSFTFEEEPMNIKIGDVNTPFHTVKVRCKTSGDQFEKEGDGTGEPLINKFPDHAKALLEDSESRRGGAQTMQEPAEADSAPKRTPSKPGSQGEAAEDNIPSSQISQAPSEEDNGVRCACGCDENDGLMMLCSNCNHWQHTLCFAIREQDEAPERHICHICAKMDDPNLQPTDKTLYGLTELQSQAIAIWRRALMACLEMNRVVPVMMSRRLGVETNVAQGLINRLEKEGFVKAPGKGKRLGKVVDREKLQEGLNIYFPEKEEELDETMEEESEMIPEPEPEPRSSQSSRKMYSPQPANSQSRKKYSPVPTNSQSSRKKYSPVPTNSQSSRRKHSQDVEAEIEDLTSQAQDINISGRRRPARANSGRSGQKKPTGVYELDGDGDAGRASRGKKRVKAVSEDQEFDLCDSEKNSNTEPRAKRSKTSIAEKSVYL